MLLQGLHKAGWEHSDPVLVAFAAANGQLPGLNVHILDPEPQTASVKQLRHEVFGSLELLQHGPHLRHREHHRQPFGLPRPHHSFQVANITPSTCL